MSETPNKTAISYYIGKYGSRLTATKAYIRDNMDKDDVRFFDVYFVNPQWLEIAMEAIRLDYAEQSIIEFMPTDETRH